MHTKFVNAVHFSFPSTELPAVITVVLYFFLSDNDLYILSNLFLSCFLFVQSCVDLKQTNKKNAECPCIIFDVFDVTPHCHAYKSLLSCLSRFHFLF